MFVFISNMQFPKLNLREFLIYLALIGAVVIFFTNFANALEQVETRDINIVSLNSLISVQGDVNFSSFLPGYNYERQLNVSLNLPSSALRGLSNDNVTVFVRMSSSKFENTSLLFDFDGHQAKVVRFELNCKVENDICSANSTLSKLVTVTLSVPANQNTYADNLVINASLQQFSFDPLEQESVQILSETSALQVQLDQLRKNIAGLGNAKLAANLSELEQLIANTTNYANLLDVNNARTSLNASRDKLTELQSVSQPTKIPPSITGHLLGQKFTFSIESILFILLLLAGFSVYLYHKHKSKRRPLDVNGFMKQVDDK